ncbi:MAG: squalene/phytoene synthase family protein [Acidobacteria bacterium]|nr:squalene/phytoene synthase family protein [Acidobacteriota bacterium]
MPSEGIGTETVENERTQALLHDLLERTSRTFALAIPLLPTPLDRSVTVAYLLFRIADTFEDATVLWSRERRLEALEQFERLLEAPRVERAQSLARTWLDPAPTDHAGYLDLLRHAPEVMGALLRMPSAVREVMSRHTQRTAHGMADFVRRSADVGEIELADLADLKLYCYVVAGIVGEMLTDLFLLQFRQLQPSADELRERASAFGEGLQLVNILKDSADDRREGRVFLPANAVREDVFALARADLDRAAEYCRLLQSANTPHGVTAFTASPVALARAALDRIEQRGPGAKLTRPEVFALHAKVQTALVTGRPVLA